MLEVIALTAADARAAAAGGAGRLEVVSDMAADGLTPTIRTVAAIRAAVDLPLRVMLRDRADFTTDPARLAALSGQTAVLREAGADAFVFGYLDSAGDLDVVALRQLADTAGRPWTLHRAFDRARDPAAAYAQARDLPGLDRILTSGGVPGLAAGPQDLVTRAGWQAAGTRFVAGGGLRAAHIPPLRSAGITEFHVGSRVRPGGSFAAPVDAALVADFAALVA